MNIEPDRTNWKKFCQELPLTDEEYSLWREMAQEIQQDDDLFDFIADRTQKEEAQAAERLDSWAGLVKSSDAHRRLRRAEIKAWQEWKEKQDA